MSMFLMCLILTGAILPSTPLARVVRCQPSECEGFTQPRKTAEGKR
jgi:hypothetical protein